ncbi:hypothetical protein GM3708_1342 [Geminocystis sp. NIES-3708]|uniref:DUF2808 domain-containing protein n=1 Tax=Geminocystis sp. NIES-3708 TaxID=1615909 RepID=UPI0005FCBF30|nr:DUF2808 domain-containing protein [Geminocystis sp. NIES-3708]BAQ60936.1 hypothetical protein GM3708_1342 [Geminocystis sp. NIES-3708]
MKIFQTIKNFVKSSNYFFFFAVFICFSDLFLLVNNQHKAFSKSLLTQVLATDINFFRASPRLIRSHPTYTFPDVISTYIFDIEIPENADNNLKKIVINQQQNTETITFFPDKTKAFILNKYQKPLDLNSTLNVSDNQNEIIINLLQPATPGDKIRLTIKARNPLYGGIYQFGITVYPEGNNPQSLYLGIARFHFDMRGGRL